ncbi:hypothetical protein Tco_1012282 [Tanacetum coccineum]
MFNGRLEQWRKALEDKGLRVNREKTEYMRCNFNRNDNDQNEEIRIGDHILESNESFRYLGSVMHKSGRIEDDVTHLVTIVNKMREGRLRWFGHVKRRPQSAPVRKVEALTFDGARRRGRPKFRWEDKLKTDLKEMLLSEDMTCDRSAWRSRIRVDEGAYGRFCSPFFSIGAFLAF